MKLLILFLLLSSAAFGQTTYYIRADTTRLQKNGGNNELILENGTRTIKGILTNVGNGRTQFIQSRKSGDTLFIGKDTLTGFSGGGGIDSVRLRADTVKQFTGATGTTAFYVQRVFDVRSYGASSANSEATNTTAFSNCIAAIIANGGGKMFISAGLWLGRITIPALPPWVTIEITGESMPNTIFGTVGVFTFPDTRTIIKSTATTGNAVIYQTPNSGSFSGTHVYVHDLEVRTYDNPLIGGIDLLYASQITLKRLQVNTGIYAPECSEPTHNTAGIITPAINNGAWTKIEDVAVSGYYKGVVVNEHTDGGNIALTANYYGLYFETAIHASHFDKIIPQRNTIDIKVAGEHFVTIDNMNTERVGVGQYVDSTAWQQRLYNIEDVSNLGKGNIWWNSVLGGTGNSSSFTKNGGSTIQTLRIGSPFYSGGSLTTDYVGVGIADALGGTNRFKFFQGGSGTIQNVLQIASPGAAGGSNIVLYDDTTTANSSWAGIGINTTNPYVGSANCFNIASGYSGTGTLRPISFSGFNGTSFVPWLGLLTDGQVAFPQYTGTNFVASASYLLGVDASGYVVKTSGGGGTPSLTENHIAFGDASNLQTSSNRVTTYVGGGTPQRFIQLLSPSANGGSGFIFADGSDLSNSAYGSFGISNSGGYTGVDNKLYFTSSKNGTGTQKEISIGGYSGAYTEWIGIDLSGNTTILGTLKAGLASSVGTKVSRYNPSTKLFTYADTTTLTSVDNSVTITKSGQNFDLSVAPVTSIVATGDITGATATQTGIISYTTPNDGTIRVYLVGVDLTVTAVAGGVVTTTVTYTDEQANSRTKEFYVFAASPSAAITTTGAKEIPPLTITCNPNTTVTVTSTLTVGTATFNLHTFLEYKYSLAL